MGKGGYVMFGSRKEIEREVRQDMKEQKENQLKWYHYLLSVFFVLVGAVFIAYVQMDIAFICKIFACVFAVAGLVSIITYCVRDIATGYFRLDLVYGIMALFIALIFFTKQDVIGVYFPVIVGCILFANGVVKLQHSIDMKRIDRKMKKVTEMWLVVMIFALMCITAGAVAVYLKPENDRTLFMFIGIALVVAGITDVFTHIVFNRKVKIFRSGDYLTKEDETSADKETEAEPAPEPAEAPVPDPEETVSESEGDIPVPEEGGVVSLENADTAVEESTDDAADTQA